MTAQRPELPELRRRLSEAGEHLCAIRGCAEPDAEFVYKNLRAYVLGKLLLEDAPESADSLRELTERSIRNAQRLRERGVSVEEVSPGCGVSSAETKRILLLLSIQKTLKVRFDGQSAAYMETVRDLAAEICRLLRERKE